MPCSKSHCCLEVELEPASSSLTGFGVPAALFTPQIEHWGKVSSPRPAGLPVCPGLGWHIWREMEWVIQRFGHHWRKPRGWEQLRPLELHLDRVLWTSPFLFLPVWMFHIRGACSPPKWVLPLPLASSFCLQVNNLISSSHIFQASQMIVSYDEHDVNNTFKFGVIYQKARQVSITNPYWSLDPVVSPWGLLFSHPPSTGALHYVLKYSEHSDHISYMN